jgi:hypothetical protein
MRIPFVDEKPTRNQCNKITDIGILVLVCSATKFLFYYFYFILNNLDFADVFYC